MALRKRPKILHLVYEDIGTPTGGMGVHVRDTLPLLTELFDITAIQFPMHRQDGAFYTVKNGVYKEVAFGKGLIPDPPDEWKTCPESYRVASLFSTCDFPSKDMPHIQRMITESMYRRNVLKILARHGYRPDLIHAHDAHLWRVVEDLRELWDCKTAITIHLSGLLDTPHLMEWPSFRYSCQTEATAYQESDLCFAVSESYRAQVAEWLERKDGLINVHNGVNSEYLSSVQPSSKLRSRYPKDKKLAVFVGRLTPQKGIEFLTAAARALPDWHFVIISHWHSMMECDTSRHLAAEVEALHNLTWEMGLTQHDKFQLMRSADVGIVPSRWEPFGIVALEWLGLGVPLVVTRVGGLPEFCNEGNASMIEPNEAALIEAIQNYRHNKGRVAKGIKTAQSFTWGKVATKYAAAYEEALA